MKKSVEIRSDFCVQELRIKSALLESAKASIEAGQEVLFMGKRFTNYEQLVAYLKKYCDGLDEKQTKVLENVKKVVKVPPDQKKPKLL